eukprot:637078-Prorocentrum_minimum.AAC.2
MIEALDGSSCERDTMPCASQWREGRGYIPAARANGASGKDTMPRPSQCQCRCVSAQQQLLTDCSKFVNNL